MWLMVVEISPFMEAKNDRTVVLPDRTGWTLLRRTVKARSIDSLFTAWSTASLEENMRASSLWKIKISSQKKIPIATDVPTATFVANLAPFPLPAPSSFATLTLCTRARLDVRLKPSIRSTWYPSVRTQIHSHHRFCR